MKIGIFGGTFNPPHLGHIRACRAFSDIIKPDRLFIIPTYLPPLKQAYDISPSLLSKYVILKSKTAESATHIRRYVI